MRTGRKLLWAALAAALPLAAAQAGVVREDIVVVHPDGRHYTAYKTLRSDIPKRELHLGNAAPEDYYFIHPGDYEKKKSDGGTLLRFDQGSYALMDGGEFTQDELTRDDNGIYTFHSWDGRVLDNGHYGKWNSPGNFKQFSFAWLYPDNFEIIDYQCNNDGDWTRAGNTLVWNGADVNDLTFSVRYRIKRAEKPAASPPSVAAPGGETSRITLDTAVLFPSGSSEFTPRGKKRLTEIADDLVKRKPTQVIVAGYTDNQPLKPYLRDKYPSNWELSAARATGVVRWLADHGVDPAILQARAFGSQHPVTDNDTAAGRAKNRRIEILVKSRSGRQAEGKDDAPTTDATASQ